LIPFNDPAEGVPASLQAFGHQFGIVLFQCGHGLECHHITLHVPEKVVWVTENVRASRRPPGLEDEQKANPGKKRLSPLPDWRHLQVDAGIG
jgi:hypothetical protein